MLVEDRERVARQFEVETRKRAPRTTDKIERQAGEPLTRPACGAEHLADRALERLFALGAERGQAEHAERKRSTAADFAARYFGKLKAAAAKVDRDTMRIRNRGKHAMAGCLGFLFAR